MDAVTTLPRRTPLRDTPHGLDPDLWFTALDNRMIETGSETCLARVVGIHASTSSLWIQLSYSDDPDVNVVLHVDAWTTLREVLERLQQEPPTGAPLEVFHFGRAQAETPQAPPTPPATSDAPRDPVGVAH
jgi:hypothetical protein